MRISSITKNAGKACNNRLYRHIRTFEKIVKNYFVIYLKPMYAVVLIWFYVVMHTEGSFDYLLLGGSLPPIKGCFLNMILAFIQTERQIWLLAAALEIVLFHSDLIIVQRLY